MTVETEVANLTSAVDNLATAVNVKKATLDASVSDAQSARDAAAASATSANNDKLAAQAAATSATNTAAALTGFDLEAIAASKAVTAVDVFVYDTSKDSDGGAWRKRTQHTSWYNETLNTATRGSRREFPAVAVIVAEASKVTIYDGDDPALPMWMVFNASTSKMPYRAVNSLSALNGVISTTGGSASGVSLISFVADDFTFIYPDGTYRYPFGSLSYRDTPQTFYNTGGAAIVSSTGNDVAMTVLPDAPIDPATGLPVPTIAVATAGGISVIRDDGTVVDLVNYVAAPPAVSFVDVGGVTKLHTTSRYSNWINVFDIPDADFNAGNYIWSVDFPTNGFASEFSETKTSLVSGWSKSLVQLQKDEALTNISGGSTANRGVQVVNHITSTYNTGWMNGDIKGAFLSSTDTASLVGSGELVTNGTFDTDLTGWTLAAGGATWDAGTINITPTSYLGAEQSIPVVVGSTYVVTVDLTSYVSAGGGRIYIGTPTSNSAYYNAAGLAVGTHTFNIKATNSVLRLGLASASAAGDVNYDNISVKLADADRSVNNKGLIVNGTVTRSPVATGAELVAYSGFSTTNYLEQPYNSALDFGTGDFCVMGWAKFSSLGTYQGLFARTNKQGTNAGTTDAFYARLLNTGALALYVWNGSATTSTTTSGVAPFGSYVFWAITRKSGILQWYINGVPSGTSVSDSSNLSDSIDGTEVLMVGREFFAGGGFSAGNTSLSLLRISATAPTAEQIKKIYEDEKVLFQDNAACTLYGTSDAVTALAHDEDTGLLHVGTSAGRSVFQGLRRVSNTTTAVGTAISASNGLVAEE